MLGAASFPFHLRADVDRAASARIPESEIAAGISLFDLDRADEVLPSKIVQTTTGEEVGRVARVLIAPDGAPKAVEIQFAKRLGAKRQKARVDPENLIYLPGREAVVTRFNEAEIAQLLREGKDESLRP